MRYLVATDGSEEAEAAVRYAASQAAAFDATLEIVHVLTPDTELIGGEIVLAGEERAMELAEQTLEEARDRALDAVDADLTVETELLTGSPPDAIVEHSEAVDVDAVFVGHRGLSEQQEQVVGSVAKSVVGKASVPVTVIR